MSKQSRACCRRVSSELWSKKVQGPSPRDPFYAPTGRAVHSLISSSPERPRRLPGRRVASPGQVRMCIEHHPAEDHFHQSLSWLWGTRFGLFSHDRCVCGAKDDPNHYATACPVTEPFHFTKPSAENLSTWYENIVQDKRSLARLMSIMILHERRHDIIMD
ncbi:hypothetical protein AVEN_76722-1 [Araneus ventricosus]|uniref:Uncharacterized protein n=1 Tax=Araneus ventricosus TaxID=182803 RepID=A0A4Y2BRS4_ARAVE|nr:hypothetical protein AVEN_76722-1 [Araneus ventricosus]